MGKLEGCLLCPDLQESIASAMLSILNPHFRKGFGHERQTSKVNAGFVEEEIDLMGLKDGPSLAPQDHPHPPGVTVINNPIIINPSVKISVFLSQSSHFVTF